MARVLFIVGDTGTGKSTSLENLDPKTTFIVDSVGDKDLPFRGSANMYNKTNKNYFTTNSDYMLAKNVAELLNGEEYSHIKTVVFEDMLYYMSKELFERSNEPGYGKFSDIARHMMMLITAVKAISNKDVILTWHVEHVKSDNAIIKTKIMTIGQMLEDKFKPEGLVAMILQTVVEPDNQGKMTYKFATNIYKHHTVAKTPKGMFNDILIDNDMTFVLNTMHKYYNK